MIFSSPSSNFQDEKLGDPLSRFVNKSLSAQHQCSGDMILFVTLWKTEILIPNMEVWKRICLVEAVSLRFNVNCQIGGEVRKGWNHHIQSESYFLTSIQYVYCTFIPGYLSDLSNPSIIKSDHIQSSIYMPRFTESELTTNPNSGTNCRFFFAEPWSRNSSSSLVQHITNRKEIWV